MDEARRAYHEDVAVRSRNKNAAYHKKNGSAVAKLGNKSVSWKEIMDQHGEIITYPSTDNLMDYASFMRLPNDLKVEFVNKMMDRYDLSMRFISKILFNNGDDGLRAIMDKLKILKLVNTKQKRSDNADAIERLKVEVCDWRERDRKARELDKIQKQMMKKSCPKLVSYENFKKLSPDDQVNFINSVIRYYQVSVAIISVELFEIRATSLYSHFKKCGIDINRIEKLPLSLTKNKEVMYENTKNFKKFIGAWKDFSDLDEPEEEEPKVIDITPILNKAKEPEKIIEEEKPVSKLPDDSELEFDDDDKASWYDDTEPVELPSVTDILNFVPCREPRIVDEKNEVQPTSDPDPMEYHEMHFSTSYISDGINMEELYSIATFFKRCKRVKVSIEITEV